MRLFAGLFLIASGIAAFWTFKDERKSPQTENTSSLASTARPVLVELFTSEGCSSCPPADALLSKLNRQPFSGVEVVALGEHVDYWNNLGWRDPYSSSDFSRRQNAYADVFGKTSIYTPQMIVDGQEEFVGSDDNKARAAILRAAQAQKALVELSVADDKTDQANVVLSVKVSDLPQKKEKAEVFLALTEDKLTSDVSRGENAGRVLTHSAVVRQLVSLGQFEAGQPDFTREETVPLSTAWKKGNLRIVVFVQASRTRRILGVASLGPSL